MATDTTLPWYDSPWLQAYLKAKAIISEIRPDALKEFESAMAVFRAPGQFQTKHLSDVLTADELSSVIAIIAGLQQEELEKHELMGFGRMVVHDHPEFTRLQHTFTDRVSELAGEELEVSYNFLSLYNNLGVCQPHMDAPSAKWTLDICLDQSEPWPISFSQVVPWPEDFRLVQDDWRQQIVADPALEFSTHAPEVNEAILFTGANQWHYRDRISRGQAQNYCHLLFFHYIPKGSRDLLEPENWAKLFNIPELHSLSRTGTGIVS